MRVRHKNDDAMFLFIDTLHIFEHMHQCSLAFFVNKIFFLEKSKSFCYHNVSQKSRHNKDVITQIEKTLSQKYKQHESIVKDFFFLNFIFDQRMSCVR